jgi:hypothetical protein
VDVYIAPSKNAKLSKILGPEVPDSSYTCTQLFFRLFSPRENFQSFLYDTPFRKYPRKKVILEEKGR